ncbi:MAG: hypothetical protein ACXWQ8_21385, partial [Ktedonobacterales bacterium]
MWPFTRKQNSASPSSQAPALTLTMEQLLPIQERLSAIQALLDGLRQRGEREEIQPLFDTMTDKLNSIESLLRSFGDSSPSSRVIEDAVHDAFMRLYRMLRDKGELAAPQPIPQPATPEGNVLLPLDPRQQYELLLMNPLQPDIYGARIILHSAYTHVDPLPYLASSNTQRHSLHIDTRKAPPGFAELLLKFQQDNRGCMYLGLRRHLPPDTFEVTYWPCVETVHAEDLINFPYHVCLYFDSNPGNQSRRYSVGQTPQVSPSQSSHTSNTAPIDQQVTP